jgi:hypothetical protein
MTAIAAIYNHSGLVGDQSVMPIVGLTNSATVATDGSFSPAGIIQPQGIAKWVDRRDGIPEGYPSFTFSHRPPTKTSRVYRVQGKLVYPVLESDLGPASNGVTPGPTKAYELTSNLEFLIPDRSTTADRRIFLSYVIGLLVKNLYASDLSPTQATGSPLISAILDLEGVY